MPSTITAEMLNSLTEAELQTLYRIIYEEMAALPKGSQSRAETETILLRIRNILARKRAASLRGLAP